MAVVLPKFTFLEQPRTGSTAVRRALIKVGGKAMQRHSYQPAKLLVATIRDPYDLVVAHWLNSGKKWGYLSIDNYVESCDRTLFVRDGKLFYHAQVAHHLLRFSHLEEDLNSFLRSVNMRPITLDRISVTSNKLKITERTRKLIDKRFGKEIQWLTGKIQTRNDRKETRSDSSL